MRLGLGGSIAIALLLGCVTSIAIVPIASWGMGKVPRASEVMLVRNGRVWHGIERRTVLVRWINLEQVTHLVNDRPDEGVVPDWAEPAPPPDMRLRRAAALGVGWPFPVVAAEWTADRLDEGFPPSAFNEESGYAPKDALRRLLDGDQKATRTVMVPQLALDTLVLALPWLVVVWALRGAIARARGGVTPPGSSAAPRG